MSCKILKNKKNIGIYKNSVKDVKFSIKRYIVLYIIKMVLIGICMYTLQYSVKYHYYNFETCMKCPMAESPIKLGWVFYITCKLHRQRVNHIFSVSFCFFSLSLSLYVVLLIVNVLTSFYFLEIGVTFYIEFTITLPNYTYRVNTCTIRSKNGLQFNTI